MHGGTVWSEHDKARAQELLRGGLTHGEIGRALGRTERSVQGILQRARERDDLPFHPYLRDLNGPAIGTDDEMLSLRRDARRGSAELREQIYRVFGA